MDKITNVFMERMEAGLMDDEKKGLCDEEREELNQLLNAKPTEKKKEEPPVKGYQAKLKNLLLAIADFL